MSVSCDLIAASARRSGKPRLIAIYSAAPQMGKTAAGNVLRSLGYASVKFADPLKRVTALILEELGVPPEEIVEFTHGARKTEPLTRYDVDFTSRSLQRAVGSELGRERLDRDLWVKIASRKVKYEMERGRSVVIDDLRFQNEYEAVKSLGGETWRIYNPRVGPDFSGHQSEGQLRDFSFDREIRNDGMLMDLQYDVRMAVAEGVK